MAVLSAVNVRTGSEILTVNNWDVIYIRIVIRCESH